MEFKKVKQQIDVGRSIVEGRTVVVEGPDVVDDLVHDMQALVVTTCSYMRKTWTPPRRCPRKCVLNTDFCIYHTGPRCTRYLAHLGRTCEKSAAVGSLLCEIHQ